jgi:zinc protease
MAAASPVFALPKVQKVVSPGGIEAWLMELNDAPLITFRIAFKGGDTMDPEGKYGTGERVAYMFDEGAGSYDAAELKRRLAGIGASFGASSGRESFNVNFSTPSAYKDEALELLRLAFTAPRFDAEPLARARAQFVTGIEQLQLSPGAIGSEPLRRTLYGKHVLGMDLASMKRGYESVTVDDLKAQRARLLVREGVKITVVGNIDAATLGPVLDKLLGGMPVKGDASPMPVPMGGSASCQHIPMNIPQAVVQFGTLTPTLSFRTHVAWWMLHTIMAEGVASGRLSRELREKRGLIYGIGIERTEFARFGVFTGAFAAKMSDVPEALAILRRELKRMVDEGPTEEEVTAVQPTQLGRTLLGLDTGAAIANLLQAVQVSKLPITYLDDLAGTIESITRHDVWEAAKLLLNPDRLVVSVVGEPGQTKVCESPAQK